VHEPWLASEVRGLNNVDLRLWFFSSGHDSIVKPSP
jgi:hypothetical protein